MANEYPAATNMHIDPQDFRLIDKSGLHGPSVALLLDTLIVTVNRQHDQIETLKMENSILSEGLIAVQKVIGTKGNYNFSQVGHTHKGIRQLIVRKSK